MADRINLLCYGDSNTYGTVPMRDENHDERFSQDVRWTGVLQSTLGDRFRVIEEGLPGRTTVHDDAIEGASRNGKTYLLPCLGSHKPIDGIVLMLGTNDLKTRFSVTPQDIRRGLEALFDVIAHARCGPMNARPKVLVVAPAPIREIGFLGEIFVGGAAKSDHLAERYEAAARRFNHAFFDAGTVISVSDVDGVHFDADQHHLLGAAIARQVTALFPA
jgi:lysophospholipase L1-like esterase